MYQFSIVSENKGYLCFGFPLNFTQYHKHENAMNILAFVHPLPAKKAVGMAKQSSWPRLLKIPHLSPHEKLKI